MEVSEELVYLHRPPDGVASTTTDEECRLVDGLLKARAAARSEDPPDYDKSKRIGEEIMSMGVIVVPKPTGALRMGKMDV